MELSGLKTITNPLIQISDDNTMQTMWVKLLAYLIFTAFYSRAFFSRLFLVRLFSRNYQIHII